MQQSKTVLFLSILGSWILPFVAAADPLAFANALTDHAVLQRDVEVPIWGRGTPGATVEVRSSLGVKASATVDKDGRWEVRLPAQPARMEPFEIMATSGKEKTKLGDLLYGDVWFGSGQSNMSVSFYGYGRSVLGFKSEVMGKKGADGAAPVIEPAALTDPDLVASLKAPIRLLYVPQGASWIPEKEILWPANWDKECIGWTRPTVKTVSHFGAAQYYFGVALQKEIGVPVGLVNASFPGTRIEAWNDFQNGMRKRKEQPAFASTRAGGVSAWQEGAWRRWVVDGERERYPAALRAWQEKYAPIELENGAYRLPDYDVASRPAGEWTRVTLPTLFNKAPWKTNTVEHTVIRCEYELTQQEAKLGWAIGVGDGKLKIRKEATYLNGKCVGISGSPWHGYGLPQDAQRVGKNVIVFEIDTGADADSGFGGAAPSITVWRDGKKTQCFLTNAFVNVSTPDPKNPRPENFGRESCNAMRPGSCHNAQTEPLYPMAIKGVLWYQGCSDIGNEGWYVSYFDNLVGGWRHRFTYKDKLPVFVTEIAPVDTAMNDQSEPVDKWCGNATMRANLARLAVTTPDCGVISLMDIGEKDIHPINKKDVGARWARLALARVYGRKIVEGGPVPVKTEFKDDGTVEITYINAVGLKARDGGEIRGFELAGPKVAKGEKRQIVRAKAVVKGDKIIVSASGITDVRLVRYAFDNMPYPYSNLVNAEGLPAATVYEERPAAAK